MTRLLPGRRRAAEPPASRYQPGARGFDYPGGGAPRSLGNGTWWRASAVQLAGMMYPHSVGGVAPMVGSPMGPGVCCDPLSWFSEGKYIPNPSEGILSLPGMGKSTVIRRQALMLHGMGKVPLALGDLKGEYVDLFTGGMGGDVLPLGPGRGSINLCDLNGAAEAAARLRAVGARDAADQVLADARAARTALLAAVLTILRNGAPPEDWEESLCATALLHLDGRLLRPPLVDDLLAVILTPTPQVLDAADAAGEAEYRVMVRPLVRSLRALLGEGRLGQGVFTRASTVRMRPGVPTCFDVSTVGDGQQDLQAALMLAIWSYAFTQIRLSHALADHHLEPRRQFFAILDELWRPLAAGRGIVDRVNSLTRLNRNDGVGQAMAMHTLSDLEAVPTVEDRAKARQMFARAGMLICGALPPDELELVRGVAHFSAAEERMLTSWTMPGSMDPRTGARTDPPGLGWFLIKIGRQTGIPFRLRLTDLERALNDTNKLWHTASRVGSITDAPAAGVPLVGLR